MSIRSIPASSRSRRFRAGTANNIIPQTAWLNGTVRTLKATTRDMVEKRIHAIASGLAAAAGATARVEYRRGYPPTVNHSAQTDFAASIARKVAGDAHVDANAPPTMGSEDFSFMLEARPGAFIFIGNGDSAMLHHPAYDFNDEVLPYGMSYWVSWWRRRSRPSALPSPAGRRWRRVSSPDEERSRNPHPTLSRWRGGTPLGRRLRQKYNLAAKSVQIKAS